MRVAVTGGSGFIGRFVVERLELQGHDPVVIDRHDGVDVRSEEAADLIRSCDAVIHLAGVLGTAELFDQAADAVAVNIGGTLNVLQACAERQTRYVGITMPQVWDNVYQATKTAAEKLARSYCRHFDVPVSHVRAFNAFGEGQKVGTPQKIIPTFADAVWHDRPVPIWGSGAQLVDLVYAGDVARMLVDAIYAGGHMEVFDAGTMMPYTVIEVAQMVAGAAGKRLLCEFFPMRKGEHGNGVLAEGEGWDRLSWRPEFRLSDLVLTVGSYAP